MSKLGKLTWRSLVPVVHKSGASTMNERTLYALASLLVLVQLPHVLNMPLWVSALGISLVLTRLALLKKPESPWLRPLLSPISVTAIAASSALMIKWDFGYFLGRDPCVAFLFILVAAKYAEVRRDVDATLLLCLSGFLLLTQYFYSQTILSALVTLPAVVALAYSLAILRDAKNPQRTAQQLKLIGSLLVQGLPIAALLFFLFPRLPGPLWSLPDDASASTGLSDSMSPGSIGKLSQSDAVAFRVEFDGATPAPEDLYWRGIVLSQFDGRSWAVSKQQYTAPPDYFNSVARVSDQNQQSTNYTVTLQPHQQRWLFALDAASSPPTNYNAASESNTLSSGVNPRAIGVVLDDGQMLSRDRVLQPLRYTQSSLLNSALPAVSAPQQDTKHLPGKNTRTIAFARELRKRSSSDSEYVNAVLRHFNQQPYRYTLEPQLLGSTPVDEFLFDSQEGFCEHYAAAFVVLMRAVGIPARVVTGYQGGEMNNDYLIVRQSNAHAWTEIHVGGLWQRIDPTAAVAPSRVEQGLAAALPNESSLPLLARQTPGFMRSALLRWDSINHHWQRLVIDFDNDTQDSLWESMGIGKPSMLQICIVAIVLTGIWSALVLGAPSRNPSTVNPSERLWRRLVKTLNERSLSRVQGESASEFLLRASERWPDSATQFKRLDLAFQRLRFQPMKSEHQQQALLKQVSKDVWRLRLTLPFRRKIMHSEA